MCDDVDMDPTFAISLATSVMTLVAMQLLAKRRWQGWAVGLANQALWVALIIRTEAWGLLLLTCALVVIYVRALIDWRRPDLVQEALLPIHAEAPDQASDGLVEHGYDPGCPGPG